MKTIRRMILVTTTLGPILALCAPSAVAQGRVDKQGPARPSFMRFENFLTVVSPRGDQVASFNVQTRKMSLVRLSGPDDAPLNVTPIAGPGVVALHLRGPKITRIAASDTDSGTLIAQDLREPAQGLVSPIVGPGIAAYVIGHHAYAFSPALNRWGVVELAAGHSEYPEIGPGHATLFADGHIYTFSSKTGKWDDIDLKNAFGPADEAAKAGPGPQK